MKLNRIFQAGLLGLALAISPGRAQDLGDTVSRPGVFSYQAPKGWSIRTTTASKNKVASDTPRGNFAANINVVVDSSPKSLSDYVEFNNAQFKASPLFQNLQIISKRPFVSSPGVQGTRLVVRDTLSQYNLQQIFYFFEGESDAKFVVTESCLVGDGDHYAPLFDASMKTFSLK